MATLQCQECLKDAPKLYKVLYNGFEFRVCADCAQRVRALGEISLDVDVSIQAATPRVSRHEGDAAPSSSSVSVSESKPSNEDDGAGHEKETATNVDGADAGAAPPNADTASAEVTSGAEEASAANVDEGKQSEAVGVDNKDDDDDDIGLDDAIDEDALTSALSNFGESSPWMPKRTLGPGALKAMATYTAKTLGSDALKDMAAQVRASRASKNEAASGADSNASGGGGDGGGGGGGGGLAAAMAAVGLDDGTGKTIEEAWDIGDEDDFIAATYLDAADVVYEANDENMLGAGAFAEVYKGAMYQKESAIAASGLPPPPTLSEANLLAMAPPPPDALPPPPPVTADTPSAGAAESAAPVPPPSALPLPPPTAAAPPREGYRVVPVAVKVFSKKPSSFSELELICQLSHPNVVRCYGIVRGADDDEPPVVVMERMQGSLRSWIRANAADTRATPHRLFFRFALDIACGMHYLHSLNPPIIHRDLKSENILLDHLQNLKIADFGVAKQEGANQGTLIKGSFRYMAPEMMNTDEADKRSTALDVYSFGVLLHEIVSRQMPWADMKNEMAVVMNVVKGKRQLRPPSIEDKVFDGVWQLINDCWAQDANDRPSFRVVMERLEALENDTFWALAGWDESTGEFGTNTPVDLLQSLRDNLGLTQEMDVGETLADASSAARVANVIALALGRPPPRTVQQQNEIRAEQPVQRHSGATQLLDEIKNAKSKLKLKKVQTPITKVEDVADFASQMRNVFSRMPLGAAFQTKAAADQAGSQVEDSGSTVEWGQTLDYSAPYYTQAKELAAMARAAKAESAKNNEK